MNNSKKISLGIICALVLIVGVKLLLPSDEQKIRKQFARMFDYMNKSANESLYDTAKRVNWVAALLTETCEIRVKGLPDADQLAGTHTNIEAAQLLAAIRDEFGQLTFEPGELEIEKISGNTATVTLQVRISATAKSGESIAETIGLRCTLQKQNGKWLFERCEVAQRDPIN